MAQEHIVVRNDSESRSRRPAAGLALMDGRRSATKIDHRRSQMESPIEVVRRFCAAWSENLGAAELAAFFTDDAVYHNIPLAPVIGWEAIASEHDRLVHPPRRARHRGHRVPRHQHRVQWSGRDDRARGRLQAP